MPDNLNNMRIEIDTDIIQEMGDFKLKIKVRLMLDDNQGEITLSSAEDFVTLPRPDEY